MIYPLHILQHDSLLGNDNFERMAENQELGKFAGTVSNSILQAGNAVRLRRIPWRLARRLARAHVVAQEDHQDCCVSERFSLQFWKHGAGTYPAMTARLLFCALSDSTEARTDVGTTNARTRNSFPTLLVRKDNTNIGPSTKMQKDRLTSVCSVRLTAFSE
jgi:hypothetical protein